MTAFAAGAEQNAIGGSVTKLDPTPKSGATRAARISGARLVGFNGEASPSEIARVAEAAGDGVADAIVGVGGGKTLDTAKAVAHRPARRW